MLKIAIYYPVMNFCFKEIGKATSTNMYATNNNLSKRD